MWSESLYGNIIVFFRNCASSIENFRATMKKVGYNKIGRLNKYFRDQLGHLMLKNIITKYHYDVFYKAHKIFFPVIKNKSFEIL